jgi:hypothetical protein
MPVPTVTVTVTATPAPAPAVNLLTQTQAPPVSSGTEALPLFSALPRGTTDATASASKLPITVSPARTSWSSSGRTFKVDFEIQYVGTDHGSQQGRIIVLARGPNALFAYPQGVLSRAGTESLISPKQGEYFSVSRFREVKAEFTDVKGSGAIQDVEILIMSLEGQLLFYQKLQAAAHPGSAAVAPRSSALKAAAPAPGKPAVPAASKPAVSGQPAVPAQPGAPAAAAAKHPAASDASELIEPGVDQ